MPRPLAALLYEARKVLDLNNQGALGTLLGSSERSGQRWERGEATPMDDQLQKLAGLVFAKDAGLAAEVAAAAGSTLEQLGIVRPVPPASAAVVAPPPPPAPDPIHIVDTVVCAAAEAMQVMPDAIRPALRAAFRRARLAGLSVVAVETALGGRTAATDAESPRAKTGNVRQKAK